MRWLARQHGAEQDDPPSTPGIGPDAARLLAAFRADPTATVLHPIVRAMSQDVTSWGLGHPAVVTAQDALLLRRALLAAPDFTELLAVRMAGLRQMLVDASETGRRPPPLAMTFDLAGLTRGGYSGLLDALPAGSTVRVDASAAARRPDEAADGRDLAHTLGLAWALSGLSADGSEREMIRRLRPDGLVFDVLPPMDYLDRLPELLRLRASVLPEAHIVVGGVTTSLEAWAAVECGATDLAGPLFDDEDFVRVAEFPRGIRPQAFRDEDADRSAFELAAARHPVRHAPLHEVMKCAVALRQRVCARAAGADVFATLEVLPATWHQTSAELDTMVAAGAALTVVAHPQLDSSELPREVMTGALPAGHPFARGWALVALLPGEGHVLAADPIEVEGDVLQRRYRYVEADDRELALRIANRITQSATGDG